MDKTTIRKVCEQCGMAYTEDDCPFCASERHWQEVYRIASGDTTEVEVLTLIIIGK